MLDTIEVGGVLPAQGRVAAAPPGARGLTEMTLFAKDEGPLTKRIFLGVEGRLVADGSACVMSVGCAQRVRLDGPADLAALIGAMPHNRALALGRLRLDLPDEVAIATERRISRGEEPNAIARTQGNLVFTPGEPAFALLDFDRKGMPEEVAQALSTDDSFWAALVRIVPQLAGVARVCRPSTSAGLYNGESGEWMSRAGGEHIYVLVRDGADIGRFLRDLHDRCWLHGFGWYLIGSAGQLLERSIVDRMVGGPERLVFEGAPVLEPPLAQDHAARAPRGSPGDALDARAACPPLTPVERARLDELRKTAAAKLRPEATLVRAASDQALAHRIAKRDGLPLATALRMVEARHQGALLPALELVFDDPLIGTAMVADVLREPERFVGETLADPMDGVAYGRCKAMVMRRPDGSLWIHSFAHGRTVYELRRDAATLEAELRSVGGAAAVDTFIRLLPEAELEADEKDRIIKLVGKLSGTSPRAVKDRVREARQRRVRHEAGVAAPQTSPTARTRLPAPASDDERKPVLASLDEVLAGVTAPEPPMRNADGIVAVIRSRQPWGLHQLTDAGVDAEEALEQRLPAPEEPLITELDQLGLGLLVEDYVEYYRAAPGGGSSGPEERPVALPAPFLQAYLGWKDGRLPTVRAAVTAPLVTRKGGLLAGTGLDRRLNLVFRIEPRLLALVPAEPDAITDAEVVEALRFLVDEWLCDVATDFNGRVVLIAYALTIIERVLLPERPAFFVTAGQRGGGKTTALSMVVAAVLGRRPAAAAWSSSPEERRKALLAYLGEGLPTLVFDNIERGAAITCPSVEKALTAAEYTDRILGGTRTMTVPSTTVLAFTGNNIAPKGDMASRSLACRLQVGQPDPENRPFHHADPVGWTLDNRERILQALYTLLRWNPQVRAPAAARANSKTRFKAWWDLVGAPLEVASMLAAEEHVMAAAGDAAFRCVPTEVDFGAMLAAGEAEEDENCGTRELVELLRSQFGDGHFTSAQLAALLHPDSATAPFPPDGRRIELAQAARAAIEGATGKPLSLVATPHVVGKRLQMLVGRPVDLGEGRVGMVVKAREGHDLHRYKVVITGAAR